VDEFENNQKDPGNPFWVLLDDLEGSAKLDDKEAAVSITESLRADVKDYHKEVVQK